MISSLLHHSDTTISPSSPLVPIQALSEIPPLKPAQSTSSSSSSATAAPIATASTDAVENGLPVFNQTNTLHEVQIETCGIPGMYNHIDCRRSICEASST
ncbi:unnamed protein product, partial [Rotaria sp. Silwood1]